MKLGNILNQVLLLVFWVTFLSEGARAAVTEPFPGVVCYDVPKAMQGRLVFLAGATHDPSGLNVSVAIYQLSLTSKHFQKITDVPDQVADIPRGVFIGPKSGGCFAVIYGGDPDSHEVGTNVFFYSETLGTSKHITLPTVAQETVIVGNDLFIRTAGSVILHYDLRSNGSETISLPGFDKLGNGRYSKLHADPEMQNRVHFFYEDGTNQDKRNGFYSYDIEMKQVTWLSRRDKDRFGGFKAADDRYILFKGPGSPLSGTVLVSSSNEEVSERGQIGVRVLASFSRPRSPGDDYWLDQISPDGHYALVRHAQQAITEGGHPVWTHIYFCVNVSTGEKHILLKDEVALKSKGFMSPRVFWLPVSDQQN